MNKNWHKEPKGHRKGNSGAIVLLKIGAQRKYYPEKIPQQGREKHTQYLGKAPCNSLLSHSFMLFCLFVLPFCHFCMFHV